MKDKIIYDYVSIRNIRDTVFLGRQKCDILFNRQKPQRTDAFGKLQPL